MEKPVLGLAYVKTAGVWDDGVALWKRHAPTWAGGTPAAPAAAGAPAPAPAAVAPGAAAAPVEQTPEQVAAARKKKVLDDRRAKEKAKSVALAKQRAAALAYERGPAGAADRERRRIAAKHISDARIAREGNPLSPEFMGNEPARANEQARREAQGNWAWENSRGLPGRSDQPRGLTAPNFRSQGMAPGRGPSKLPSTASSIAPGMTQTGFVAGANQFLDRGRLEGQGAPGVGLDEFDRYMARYYPEAQKASRERYATSQIPSGGSPTYEWQGKKPGAKPISYEVTDDKQAERMNVLGYNGQLRDPADPLINRPKPRAAPTPAPAPEVVASNPVKPVGELKKGAQAALGDGALASLERKLQETPRVVRQPSPPPPQPRREPDSLSANQIENLNRSLAQGRPAAQPAPPTAPVVPDALGDERFKAWTLANQGDDNAPLAVPKTNTGWVAPERAEVTAPVSSPPVEQVSEQAPTAIPTMDRRTQPERTQRNMERAGISASLTPVQQARLNDGDQWQGSGKPRQTLQEWYSNPKNVRKWNDFVNEGRYGKNYDTSRFQTYNKYYRPAQAPEQPPAANPPAAANPQAAVQKVTDTASAMGQRAAGFGRQAARTIANGWERMRFGITGTKPFPMNKLTKFKTPVTKPPATAIRPEATQSPTVRMPQRTPGV
jgi:hypothetical protein